MGRRAARAPSPREMNSVRPRAAPKRLSVMLTVDEALILKELRDNHGTNWTMTVRIEISVSRARSAFEPTPLH